ncbi:hypothetical protein [Streptomyces arboris]|uniref:ATP/GTP-binding protein n=1 Tax=Streptomyces arboris TaxID=2600619 RepID=A0A5N5EFQ3_9ACTN|nr:hypothetical protein [Streptomyces arboris]KAB2587720.1 hypothetical protein F5983_36395 [Streptomyces arboris]
MIRLPSTHAAITAPLPASSAQFPGIAIGRSLLDGREFRLSPVLTPSAVLPSTNSLGMGGLGSGKSTTAKTRIRREILDHGHQAVVIDSFGEDNATGEWAPLVRSLGGKVIEAGAFTLNPCSDLFPPEVREQLVRSLILAVEPSALTPQATHALQHGLNSPKAVSLVGLVDALAVPEDGRWPAARLTEWGEGAAIALSRYTEGSLRGLFDGQDAALPPVDLPILSFDFTRLDRNSPAIPSLMAAVSCWAEHVWLPQSTAVHRHLVLEEAWQILLSPATSELIQRLLKNSRKASLSLDVVMHTLSDLGDGRAQDLARLCEVAHVGRLGPEEAAIVGTLLGLPQWAISTIPTLGPGQAVWKVGPSHVDIIETVLTEEEAALTDTSSRRRRAQEAAAVGQEEATADEHGQDEEPADDDEPEEEKEEQEEWAWEMPPNVIDWHERAIQAAREGRCSEAADLAALGEREDIANHGLNSPEAVRWMSTRAHVADLCGSPGQAAQLRATVAHMGNSADRPTYETPVTEYGPQEPAPLPAADDDTSSPARRRILPAALTVGALGLALAFVWANPGGEEAQRQQRDEKTAAAYEGQASAVLDIDGVDADLVAEWTGDKEKVILRLLTSWAPDAQYLRIDVGDRSAISKRPKGESIIRTPEIVVPVKDPRAEVTVRVAIGGPTWQEGYRAPWREIRLSPVTGAAVETETGKTLPST